MVPIENVVLVALVLIFAGWFLYSFVNTPVPLHEDEVIFREWDKQLQLQEEAEALQKLFFSLDNYIRYKDFPIQVEEVREKEQELFRTVKADYYALLSLGIGLPKYKFADVSTVSPDSKG